MSNNNSIEGLLEKYKQSFDAKEHVDLSHEPDVLMNLFGVTPEMKKSASQYWGRELGTLFESLCKELFSQCEGFRLPSKNEFEEGEPVDMFIGNMAIDTKYRIGSGDAGTLSKFRRYGSMLKAKGYDPVFLVLREDSLSGSLQAARAGGWRVIQGEDTFDFISKHSGMDFLELLNRYGDRFRLQD